MTVSPKDEMCLRPSLTYIYRFPVPRPYLRIFESLRRESCIAGSTLEMVFQSRMG